MTDSWALFVAVHYLVLFKRCSALFFSGGVMVKKVHHLFPKHVQALLQVTSVAPLLH